MMEPTPEVIERILQAIRGGNFRAVAARWAGVEPQDLKAWLEEGKDEPEGVCGQFRKELLEAETQAEITCVALVMKAARDGDSRHAEWWLSHKLSQRWGKKLQHEVSYVYDHLGESTKAKGPGRPNLKTKVREIEQAFGSMTSSTTCVQQQNRCRRPTAVSQSKCQSLKHPRHSLATDRVSATTAKNSRLLLNKAMPIEYFDALGVPRLS